MQQQYFFIVLSLLPYRTTYRNNRLQEWRVIKDFYNFLKITNAQKNTIKSKRSLGNSKASFAFEKKSVFTTLQSTAL
jgi:hypothetical protein